VRLAVENLTVARGERTVIRSLSFEVGQGEILVLTGPNGSGKTTLIRALAGFLPPAAGSIRLSGGEPERDVRDHCHYVGHANGIKSALTVAANLAFWADYLGATNEESQAERVAGALEAFDLAPLAEVPAGFLSAGQKRRLGLARLFVARRPLWLLDEPTASLDAASAARLGAHLSRRAVEGGLVIAATHLPLGVEGARTLRLGETEAA
jgi:heme exporter protein A